MQDLSASNLIETICGKTFVIDFLDQVALGIYEPGKFEAVSAFIPSTFSVYKTAGPDFILEITKLEANAQKLITTYQLISAEKAKGFIENGGHDIFVG